MLQAGDSEKLTQSLAEQKQTVDDIHVQRAQIESELDAAETKLVTAMTEASQVALRYNLLCAADRCMCVRIPNGRRSKWLQKWQQCNMSSSKGKTEWQLRLNPKC